MTVLPLLQLTDGLHTSPIEAGQNHVADALNVISHDGHLEKRQGSVPFMVLPGLTAQPTVGWSSGWSTEPTVVSAVANLAPPFWATSLYVGYSSTFNRVDVSGVVTGAGATMDLTGFWARNTMTLEYWNGTLWKALPSGDLFRPRKTVDGHPVISPWHNTNGGDDNSGQQGSYVFDVPSDWAAKNIAAAGSKFWMRVKGLGWEASGSLNAFDTLATVSTTSCTVQTTENRVLHVQRFNDARGTAHTFAAFLYGNDGKTLKFSLDGVVMSQSAGLQPDGTSVMFSPDTKVSAFYVAANDRVVGHVSGLGWFFFCPSETFVTAPSIYSFEPDDIGTDTPYQNVLEGLRSAIPDGTVSCFHQGRVFVANGQTVAWNAPTPYVDIWPFGNEGFIPDAFGNITGMASVGGVLAIFKRNSVWILQSDGTSDGYYATPIPGGVGCVSQQSIVSTGNQLFFAAEDGVYTFDGSQVVKTTDAIDGLWQRPSFCSNMEKSVGVYYTPNQQFRLFYPSSASSNILDAALYAEISGWATQSTDGAKAASWWPQGKKASTEYGFNATALCSDSTSDRNRMLIGDRYGVIWEADVGVRDAGQVVKARVRTHRLNYGSGKKMIVRWAVVSQANKGNFDGQIRMWPEGREDDVQTGVLNLYTAADGSVFTAAGVFTSGGLFVAAPDLAELRNSFSIQGKWFQVELLEENAAPWEFDGLELEVNPQGRRT